MAGLTRIILHWTAGAPKPCSADLTHYHYIIDQNGVVHTGKYKPEDNLNCGDGKYAQHTGGGNTGSIGISMCGMYNFSSRTKVGPYPLTKVQVERCFKLVAELSKKYGIPITKENVMTHYEFGKTHPKTTSAGKIDIIYLPCYPNIKQAEVGDFIRSKANWYRSKI